MCEIADQRIHGTTGETPLLLPAGRSCGAAKARRPPCRQVRELVRPVQPDRPVEVDRNSYSVPCRLIGASVQVVVAQGRVHIRHRGREVAVHAETTGRHQLLAPAHFHGVAGATRPVTGAPLATAAPELALLRPLAGYERAVGGGWA